MPKTAPGPTTDPIHDISLSEITPEANGVAFDCINGIDSESHPVAHPTRTIIKWAGNSQVAISLVEKKKLKMLRCKLNRQFIHEIGVKLSNGLTGLFFTQKTVKKLAQNLPAMDAEYCSFMKTDSVFMLPAISLFRLLFR